MWWAGGVVYQVYPRSFADGDGDGVGDLAGLTARFDHIAGLGADAIWLTPFQRSPQKDHGYDVSDYTDVDPLFGDLAAFDTLVARAHGLGLRVIVDIVPNHCSDQHPVFQRALAGDPTARARFHFNGTPADTPAGTPDGILAGTPDGTPTGAPDGTPAGAPVSTPAGAPVGTPGGTSAGTPVGAPTGAPEEAPTGPSADQPPNNWPSVFGGPAWTQVSDGSWYLHLYAPEQPDWNWRDPRTAPFFDEVLRFWLDRGVDGLRIDVAHGLFKAPGLPSLPPGTTPEPGRLRGNPHACDQPETIDVYRRWRKITDGYDPPRALIGEVNLDPHRAAAYVGDDRLHQSFAFQFLIAPWDALSWRDTATRLLSHRPVTWVVENHDVVRTATRYGNADRARAALLTILALPGATYLYQGQEYSLPEADVPAHARQDPAWHRSSSHNGPANPDSSGNSDHPGSRDCPGSSHRPGSSQGPSSSCSPSSSRGPSEFGGPGNFNGHGFSRDGCRVPLPWPDGFSPPGAAPPWLPVPAGWDDHLTSPTLPLTRKAIAIRRDLRLSPDDPVTLTVDHDDRLLAERPQLTLVVAMGKTPVPLPTGDILLTSGPLTRDAVTGQPLLPPDTAAWLTPL
ncbi:alpha-amylase family glycosyl hydrolase [Actinoplanes sp. NPDC023801]|uniref:alpha-amylase family glycosyl hydrolase n=1 Tax=Actinoplanes sp. NPDC023801 TaxID=3154595 RepID=UPI003403DA04